MAGRRDAARRGAQPMAADFSPAARAPYDAALDALKVPPHSIEAEQAVLGGLMLDNEAWPNVVERIGFEDFYRRDHANIFRAIEMLANDSKPFDVVTLAEWWAAWPT
jgi:replicative DNA helicase